MRIKFIRGFFLTFLVIIIIRLFYWQIIQADFLSAAAESQHVQQLKLQATRGQIFFSDGFVLASTKPTFTLFAEPKKMIDEDKKMIATKLAKMFAKDTKEELDFKKEFLERLSQDLFWVLLRKNLEIEEKKEIEEFNSKGLGFEATSSRFYPEGSSSAHILGFVGQNSKGDDTGYFGIEGFYDRELRGVSGLVRHEKDALGLPILNYQFLNQGADNGKSLVLNIDRVVQYIVEDNLKKGMAKYEASAASAIVMDPKTGAILALAAYPNYDPALYGQSPKEFYKNPIVADQYEPGSTFKVLVMSAAVNEDVIKPETECDSCSGPVNLGGFTIRTWNNQYRPNLTMTDVIIHSDNTGMVFVGKKLGLDKLYQYLQDFGFGTTTNIDLQDEFSPDLRDKEAWREIDLATTSFGQGIAITPIQMIKAVGAIASGGNLMEPHVVREIEDQRGSFVIKPKIIRQVIKESSAKTITEMMVKAVVEGEAKFAKPTGFKIAGKTGTAQIPIAGHYDPNKTIASFVGFAPADNPKFVMLVRYDQPSSSPYGSETAAPTFFEIAKELFTYYKIAPSE